MRHFDPFEYLAVFRDVGVLVVSVGGAAWAWFRVRHAHSWPSAQGTVMGTRVKPSGNWFQPWNAELVYSYVVKGEYYSGSSKLWSRSRRRADERVAGWKNRMIVVRYSPNNPDLSAVLKSDQPGGQLGN